jgi:tetratricopeptide (TPR) repeat protein
MVAELKTFVSFSSRDSSFMPRVLSRLSAQPLNVWDYSVEGEEIPGGEEIGEYLRERVACSSLFLPVVTRSSAESRYVALEVQTALARHREGALRIIPLVEKSMATNLPWGEPFSALHELRYHVFDGAAGNWGSVEEAVARVCQDLRVPYVAPRAETPRFPLVSRMEAELRERLPCDPERTNALFARLERTSRSCMVALAESDYPKALKAIDYFIAIAENEYSSLPFYYPYLARAVCLIALGRLPEAAEVLTSLRAHGDESVLGALGHIRQSQGLYAEAASLYREALQRDPKDEAAATGVLVNEVCSGILQDFAKAYQVVEKGTYLSEADRQAAQGAMALALAKSGKSDQAAEMFTRLMAVDGTNTSHVINLANTLVDLGRPWQAREVLVKASADFPQDLQVARWTARFFLENGMPREALPYVRRASALAPDNAEYLYDQLCAERRARDPQALETAQHLLRIAPRSLEDFFYVGYANWVLGRRERAEYDRERSGSSVQYAAVEPD